MSTELVPHRFSLEEYEAMIESGILDSDDHVELIHGVIAEMSPIGSPHAACVDRLTRQFMTAFPEEAATVSNQNPIHALPDSAPQPDVTLLQPRADYYASTRPTQANVLLVVEVADSSLRRDRIVKIPLYAEAGIREAWLIDVNKASVEVYRDPLNGRYTDVKTFGKGDSISPLAFPNVVFAVNRLV